MEWPHSFLSRRCRGHAADPGRPCPRQAKPKTGTRSPAGGLGRNRSATQDSFDDVLAVNEALDQLAEQEPIKAELVKLRYFMGLSVEEAADVLGVSRATADWYWRYAKTWLYCALTRRSSL